MTAFRLQGKQLFLTFPQVDSCLTLQDIQKLILNKEQRLSYLLIAKENHDKAGVHYHIILVYKHRKNIRRQAYFDYIFHKHGNYQSIRSLEKNVDYVKKGDCFLEGGSYQCSLDDAFEKVITLIRDGKTTVHQVIQDKLLEDKLLFARHNQLDRFERRLQQYQFEQLNLEKRPIKDINLKAFRHNPTLRKIISFIRANLNPERPYKSAMLHIGSKHPNTGKSALVRLLAGIAPVFEGPDDNGFQCYSNGVYQFIIWDEFTLNGWQVQFLNKFFAGDHMTLPVKGSHSMKDDNPLIIMCSNQPLKGHLTDKWNNYHYMKKTTFGKTLRARVYEIEIEKPLFNNYTLGKRKVEKSLVFDTDYPNLTPLRIKGKQSKEDQ